MEAVGGFMAQWSGLDKLLSLPSRTYGVGPALRLPIFDGGRLKAQQRGKQAELDAAVARG